MKIQYSKINKGTDEEHAVVDFIAESQYDHLCLSLNEIEDIASELARMGRNNE